MMWNNVQIVGMAINFFSLHLCFALDVQNHTEHFTLENDPARVKI